ncbi:site-2 protease family protein [Patescibacteria group bacterium]|nr:site-2 protease family protein [Patescibacteria group bacterium]
MLVIIQILSILYAIIIHEFSHAFAAYKQGDMTARDNNRLTLNPIPHLDTFGTILLPAMLILSGSPLVIGWAKPVPINPGNFKNQKWGNTIVSLAGPLANLLSAILFVIVLKVLVGFGVIDFANYLATFLSYLIIINTVLMIFNLIPIPPLDGSKFLFDILPAKYNNIKVSLSNHGPWILLMLLIADSFLGLGIFSKIIGFFVNLIYGLV